MDLRICAEPDMVIPRRNPVKVSLRTYIVKDRFTALVSSTLRYGSGIKFPLMLLICEASRGTGEIAYYIRMKLVRYPVFPVQRRKNIAPGHAKAETVASEESLSFPILDCRLVYAHIKEIPAHIDIQRQLIVFRKEMCHRCIKVSQGISSVNVLPWFENPSVEYGQCRDAEHIKPASSHAHIERCLSRNDGALELHSTVEEAYREHTMVFMHIAFARGHIHDRGKLSPVTGGETALVKVHMIKHFRIESREKAGKMTDLIERHSVEQKEIVVTRTAMDMQSGKHLCSRRHSRQLLQALDQVRLGQRRRASLEMTTVELLKTSLSCVPFSVQQGRDP